MLLAPCDVTPSRCPVGYSCTNTDVASTNYVYCKCKSCPHVIFTVLTSNICFFALSLPCCVLIHQFKRLHTMHILILKFTRKFSGNTFNSCFISAPCDPNPCSSGYYCSYTATSVNGKYYTCSGIVISTLVKGE